MEFFTLLFVVLLMICVGVQFYVRKGEGAEKHVEVNPGFKNFQMIYLIVYFINMAADWMQGPYVYALYASYGFSKSDIAVLFIFGFFSSMVFGTFVGSVADKYGRKKLGILFGVLYGMSCVTKLYNDFNILLFGRLLGGIATSLLYSVFESWMIYEHHKRGYSGEALSQTFAYATFGNGCVAILASLGTSFVADKWGYVAPFMLSLFFLIMGSIIIALTWSENYGTANINLYDSFANALQILKEDRKVLLLGTVQSLFEASMYMFVFMWTPVLENPNDPPLPFGLIFACYMVSIMIGSSIFSIALSKFNFTCENLAQYVFATAAFALFTPFLTHNRVLCMLSFCIFEMTCGLYWPCLGTLKAKYIPEASRSTIMNFFRVPLNLIVVVVLVKISSFENSTIFLICVGMLSAATVGQNSVMKLTSSFAEKKDIDNLTSQEFTEEL